MKNDRYTRENHEVSSKLEQPESILTDFNGYAYKLRYLHQTKRI